MRAPTPVPARDADLAARRVAIGLSRNYVSTMALVGPGIVLRAEAGTGRPYTDAEVARLELVIGALEHARKEAARLAIGAA